MLKRIRLCVPFGPNFLSFFLFFFFALNCTLVVRVCTSRQLHCLSVAADLKAAEYEDGISRERNCICICLSDYICRLGNGFWGGGGFISVISFKSPCSLSLQRASNMLSFMELLAWVDYNTANSEEKLVLILMC